MTLAASSRRSPTSPRLFFLSLLAALSLILPACATPHGWGFTLGIGNSDPWVELTIAVHPVIHPDQAAGFSLPEPPAAGRGGADSELPSAPPEPFPPPAIGS